MSIQPGIEAHSAINTTPESQTIPQNSNCVALGDPCDVIKPSNLSAFEQKVSHSDHTILPTPDKFKRVLESFNRHGAIWLAHEILGKLGVKDDAHLSLGNSMFGSYHILFPVLADGHPMFLIKVPSNGVGKSWTKESEDALRSEALTMVHLRDSSVGGGGELPVPRVFAFSATVDNCLSCAYIAIDYIHGFSLHKVWYGHLTNPAQFNIEGALARQLRTLEGIINFQARLGQYTYKQGGSFEFSPYPTVDGHTFVWDCSPPNLVGVRPGRMVDQEKMLQMAVQGRGRAMSDANESENDDVTGNSLEQPSAPGRGFVCRLVMKLKILLGFKQRVQLPTLNRGAEAASVGTSASRSRRTSTDSQSSVEPMYYSWGPVNDELSYITRALDVNPPTHPYQQGVHKLLRHIISWIPDTISSENDATSEGKFVLAHPDLNMQNIIVDEDGTLLGIIDWDNVSTVPRVFGNETYPSFLTRDWDPNVYNWSSSMRRPSSDSSSRSFRMHEDSPEEIRNLRRAYLQLMDEKQKKECPFTPHYRKLCLQSVVVENVFLAAYDPMSRLQIMAKIISRAWLAYRHATGEDLTRFSVYRLVQQFNEEKVEAHIMEQLQKAFFELLKDPDAEF